jgi:hypothetical protein
MAYSRLRDLRSVGHASLVAYPCTIAKHGKRNRLIIGLFHDIVVVIQGN